MDNNEQAEKVSGANKRKRKRKEIAPFGNYRNYYGYRIGQEFEEDPRLKVLKKEWFEGKDCLDIGCNNGLITIAIAKKFHCQSILGIDIDPDRVEDAHWNLRKILRKESAGKMHSNTSKIEAVERANGLHDCTSASSNEQTKDISRDFSTCKEKDLSDIASFQQENFVQSWRPPQDKSYHTILCLLVYTLPDEGRAGKLAWAGFLEAKSFFELNKRFHVFSLSVTKWIHLNWGDDGLITLFVKIWKLLHPGGILVLEPQPWSSYAKNRLVSERTAANYSEIIFFPNYFQEILLDKVGFRKVENLTSSLSGSKTGFNRPILAFQK